MLTSPHLHEKDREVRVKTRSPPASLQLKGQVTEQTTVKWAIADKLECFATELSQKRLLMKFSEAALFS